eukprot:TRINITY_DN24795_c0_g1_i1.p1 TRINITY_DN24795_c0_g1~~TRINITY_DN24795_c0_g1_i1.p1  ORF type:complete len:176 (-),score=36.49 TRINITY_DN24795_c0_g1_i1:450-977(-)
MLRHVGGFTTYLLYSSASLLQYCLAQDTSANSMSPSTFAALEQITVEDAKNARWDWNGCNVKELCECKLNGEVGTLKGTDIAEECQENGYAVPKTGSLHLLTEAMKVDKFRFQCDSLKLNAFCYNQNGCLSDANKALCLAMKGDVCDVDCNSAVGLAPRLFLAVLLSLALLRIFD